MKHAVLPYSVVVRALADIARAQGMIKMARDAGLVEDGNPSLATVLKVVNALGLRLRAEAA